MSIVITKPIEVKKNEVPNEIKVASKQHVVGMLEAILLKINALGMITTSTEDEKLLRLNSNAVGLFEFCVRNMNDEEDKELCESIQKLFSNISSKVALKHAMFEDRLFIHSAASGSVHGVPEDMPAKGSSSVRHPSKETAKQRPQIPPALIQPVTRASFLGDLKRAQVKRFIASIPPKDTARMSPTLSSAHLDRLDRMEEPEDDWVLMEGNSAVTSSSSEAPKTQLQKNVSFFIGLLRNQRTVDTEGIFRLSGTLTTMNRIDLNKLDTKAVSNIKEVHAVTGLLKKMLREMPVALLAPVMNELLSIELPIADIDQLKKIIASLPTENREILKELFEFLAIIAANAKKNKMPSTNLATCIMPNLVPQATSLEEQMAMLSNFAKQNEICAAMIDHSQEIF